MTYDTSFAFFTSFTSGRKAKTGCTGSTICLFEKAQSILKLSELFTGMCRNALELQNDNGSMPAGHNGPHNDEETPVRNTSHWLISFAKAFELSGDAKFKAAAMRCLGYLKSPEARPENGAFRHRNNPKKDFTNGIVGQAWTLEALVYAFRQFKDDAALKLAEEVFNLHPYNTALRAWETVSLSGEKSGPDKTFNHQLWFASVGCCLVDLGIRTDRHPVMHFVYNIHKIARQYPDGVFSHYPYGYGLNKSLRQMAGKQVYHLKQFLKPDPKAYSHSAGYHAFNTYALHSIRKSYPEAPVFKKPKFRKSLEVFEKPDFRRALDQAAFGFPYNPPGIEIAVSLQSAGYSSNQLKKSQEFWLNKQISINFDPKTFAMTRNTPDPLTYQARIYELYQLNNFDLQINLDIQNP